jgi:hypothetical protein
VSRNSAAEEALAAAIAVVRTSACVNDLQTFIDAAPSLPVLNAEVAVKTFDIMGLLAVEPANGDALAMLYNTYLRKKLNRYHDANAAVQWSMLFFLSNLLPVLCNPSVIKVMQLHSVRRCVRARIRMFMFPRRSFFRSRDSLQWNERRGTEGQMGAHQTIRYYFECVACSLVRSPYARASDVCAFRPAAARCNLPPPSPSSVS